ncbi:DUF1801 domain-containing protein [Marinicella meishanensis]|uniref:DUF1801 domain-containing protein n=1 Tax=Marinicella meishanensis TaxID=2873263 RepID=UPI001CBB2669|nr:DUF1801 domain-containing protein [Marinicella sp. NBU2979]
MHAGVANLIDGYPTAARQRFLQLREMLHQTACDITEIQESLKWGEPSYQSPKGSPIRFAWKAANPDELGVYFNCNTRLVSTFRELLPELSYHGNRAIKLSLTGALPVADLRLCFDLALLYHQLKHLPLLGVNFSETQRVN